MNYNQNTNAAAQRLFDKSHEPVWNPPIRVMHKTLPGRFPTAKSAHQTIRYRLPLMADGLMHLDTDPQIIGLSAYPVSFSYVSESQTDEQVNLEHRPDLAILFKDRNTAFVDFIPYRQQRATPFFTQQIEEIGRHIREHYDSAYSVLDERHVYAQPLFDNIQLMWANKELKHDIVPLRQFRAQLRTLRFPKTVGEIRRAITVTPNASIYDGMAFPRLQEDQTFAALMQLANSGELDIELDRPFSDQTKVWLNTRS